MGVQPTLPPGVYKLKLIKSLLKALQSLPLFAPPVFPPKESILTTNGNSDNFNDDIKIKRNNNGNFNKDNNENDYSFNNFHNLFNAIFENDNVKNNKIIDFLSDFNDIKD